MELETWTIEADIPFIELDAPTRRMSLPPFWCTDELGDDEAPTRIDGKVRVLGDPMELKKRAERGKRRASVPAPKHADGPGPSIHFVVTRYIGE
jgi:hypothetical protein